jgi:dTDP-4-amino-4,6-dideoxygalactose transaminase
MIKMENEFAVPFVNLKGSFLDDKKHLCDIFEDVGMSGNFILGKGVHEFEKNFANYCGVKFAIGVGNGSDSLFLVMKALGIGPGDEVITQPNSFIATTWSIIATGATPVFVDVDDLHSLDHNLLRAAITGKTKAIIPVHIAGNPCDMEEILKISEEFAIPVIEDAAQSVGASIGGSKVGSFGIAGSFSLHPLKNLGVLGDGGIITTNDAELNQTLRLLRNHGLKDRDHVEIWGYNSRLDEIQARFADFRLNSLDESNSKVKKIAMKYDLNLEGIVTTPKVTKDSIHVYHNYIIQVQDRDSLAAHLLSRGIDTRVHYPIPIHLQKAAQSLNYPKGSFPMTEKFALMSLSLPIYPLLSDLQVSKVIDGVQEYFRMVR